MGLAESINGFRIYNQGIPNKVVYLARYPPPERLLRGLKRLGHKVGLGTKSVVQALYRDKNIIYAVSDPRKPGGKPAGS